MKKFVISEPYVSENILQRDTDTFIIVACDGVWDVLSDDDVAAIATTTAEKELPALTKGSGPDVDEEDKCIADTLCQVIAKAIIAEALSRGSTDNITCVVVQL